LLGLTSATLVNIYTLVSQSPTLWCFLWLFYKKN